MRSFSVWAQLLDLGQVVVESVDVDDLGESVIVSVRPGRGMRRRCPRCRRRCPGFDRGAGRRRWRALDVGVLRTFVEADAPRVRCPEHGVIVAAVPWARHDSGHTRAFDDLAAWLVRFTSKSAVGELLRIAWRTVGAIVARVVADADAAAGDRLAGVRRIGIDRKSTRLNSSHLARSRMPSSA